MNWKVLLAAISLIKELIQYLREHRKCDCPATQEQQLVKMTENVREAREKGEDLKFTA